MTTPADLRKQAAEERAAAAAHRTRAMQALSRAEVLDRAANELDRLTNAPNNARVRGNMEATTAIGAAKPAPKKRPGRPMNGDGPLSTAARNTGLNSIADLARILGENTDTAKSWDRRRRAPPRIIALLTAPPYSVPVSAWK